MRFRGEAVHRGGQRAERRVREQGAGATKEANGTEPTEPRRLICAQSGRAQRTKQTARKSTGGAAPRMHRGRGLAAGGAASRAAVSHAVGSGGRKPQGGAQPPVHGAAEEPLFAWGASPAEGTVAEAPSRVLVESGAVAGPGGRRGAVVDVDPWNKYPM